MNKTDCVKKYPLYIGVVGKESYNGITVGMYEDKDVPKLKDKVSKIIENGTISGLSNNEKRYLEFLGECSSEGTKVKINALVLKWEISGENEDFKIAKDSILSKVGKEDLFTIYSWLALLGFDKIRSREMVYNYVTDNLKAFDTEEMSIDYFLRLYTVLNIIGKDGDRDSFKKLKNVKKDDLLLRKLEFIDTFGYIVMEGWSPGYHEFLGKFISKGDLDKYRQKLFIIGRELDNGAKEIILFSDSNHYKSIKYEGDIRGEEKGNLGGVSLKDLFKKEIENFLIEGKS